MKSIDSLKNRLSENNTLIVQNEGGFIGEMGFEWKNPASDADIQEFEVKYDVILPDSYKEFLKISNGALLFKDIQYGQWGCKILGLDELINTTKEVSSWGYGLNSNWIVYATWLGDCDILVFNLEKHKAGEKNFIIDGEQGERVSDWITLKGDFGKWLDRLIVSQGAKYWRWY